MKRPAFAIRSVVLAVVLSFRCGGFAATVSVDFADTPLAMALEHLSQNRQDDGPAWNLVYDPAIDRERPVTLRLAQVPVTVAMAYAIDQAGFDYRVDRHAILVVPAGDGELAKKMPLPPEETARFPAATIARDCRLGQVEFVDTPILDVLGYLAERSREVHPRQESLNLVLSREVDPSIPVYLKLQQVAISEVLQRISQITGLEIRIEPHAIFLDAPGASARQPKRTGRSSGRRSSELLGTPPKDPRSPAHPEYVGSNAGDIRTRTNALNNVYKWVNGKWTFVRYGGGDLDENGRRLEIPTLGAKGKNP